MKATLLFLSCLSIIFCLPLWLGGQEIRYNESREQFYLNTKPELQSDRGKWGMFFWEFGDGHYEIVEERSERVEYIYRREPQKPVTVYLTPYYTKLDKPRKIQRTPGNIRIDPDRTPRSYDLEDMLVHVETSAGSDNLLIPGHEVRVVVHYKAPSGLPANTPGYVMVFLNPRNPGFKLKHQAFRLVEDSPTLYYGEEYIGTEYGRIASAIPATAISALSQLRLSYQQVYLFRTGTLDPGEERRLFFTIRSDERLRNLEARGNAIEIKAVWVPAEGGFDEDRQITTYEMRIDSIHDPNRIRVRPGVAYFRPNPTQKFFYRVDFQNEAEGIVQDVEIKIPLDESLDPESVSLSSKEYIPCATPSDTMNTQCFKKQILEGEETDTLMIKIFNADLLGKEGERTGLFKKHTKGRIEFEIDPSGEKKQAATRTRAEIRFVGVDPIETNAAVVRWRYHSISLQGGYAFGHSAPEGFEPGPYELTDQLTFGLSFADMPLGTGLLWGIEARAGKLKFFRDTLLVFDTNGNFPRRLEVREQADQYSLDILGKIGYQFFGVVRGFAFGGITMPMTGTLNMDILDVTFNPDQGEPIIQQVAEANYGIFQRREPIEFLGETFNLDRSVGWTAGLAVEVGKLEVFAVGGRYQIRNFKIYDGSCQTFNHFEAYLRLKLFGGF